MTSFLDKPTLIGRRVRLRPITVADADDMWDDIGDAEAQRLTGTHDEFTHEQIVRWCATRAEQSDRLDLAVIDVEHGHWAGEAVIHEWDPRNGVCGFRIALSAAARNQGLGTEATQLLVDHVFGAIDDPPVNRLELEVYAFNPRARAVYERVGFQHEGTRREALRWSGAYVDCDIMAMLRHDWERATRPTRVSHVRR